MATSLDTDLVLMARSRAFDLRARADQRRKEGWEISDVMTPRQLEALAYDFVRLADALNKAQAMPASISQ